MKIIISERQYNLISEQPDSVIDSRGKNISKTINDIPELSLDDTIDVISAAFEAVPGIGNAISLGIDGSHGISYIVRFIYSKTIEEQIEYACMALITLGTSYIPVGGNTASILMRKGIKDVLQYTPVEIMMLGQKLGLVDKTRFFLSKKAWKYNFLLVLAKIFRSKLSEALAFCIKKLYEIYHQIKKVNKLSPVTTAVLSFITLLKEFTEDADFAVKLVEKGNL